MINEAMYGEKACTASELALRVMQRDAQKGQQHITDTQADFQASGAAGVTATPNAGNPEPQKPEGETEMSEEDAIAMILGTPTNKAKED